MEIVDNCKDYVYFSHLQSGDYFESRGQYFTVLNELVWNVITDAKYNVFCISDGQLYFFKDYELVCVKYSPKLIFG